MTFSREAKHKEAAREARQRERVYERPIAAGRMKQDEADRKIAIMREIAADYAPTGDLFGGKAK